MKVLIVEDNPTVRRMIKNIVVDLAEAVFECADGSEALAAYEKHEPDWVLMDVRMKQVDGLAATRQITAAHPGARVLIVTNYDEADLRQAATSAGACGYVVKDDLFEIHRILKAVTSNQCSMTSRRSTDETDAK